MTSPYIDEEGCKALAEYLDEVRPGQVVILDYGHGARTAHAWAWQRRVPFRLAKPDWASDGRPAGVLLAERLARLCPSAIVAWDHASHEAKSALRTAFQAGAETHLLTVGSTRTSTRTVR